MNLHSPARYPDESMEDYRARRQASRLVAKALETTKKVEPLAVETSIDGKAQIAMPYDPRDYWTGQHKNVPLNEKRAAKRRMGARKVRNAIKLMRRLNKELPR